MKYYAIIIDNKIDGKGQCPCSGDNNFSVEITEEIYNNLEKYMWDGANIVLDPDYEQKQKQKEREQLDALTLTPADVERALYKTKGMDFEDLKTLIAQQIPTIDIKGLAIEFRAKDFYRGAMANGIRLFDVIGQLLNITSEQLDKFFETKDYHYLMDEDNNDL